ncbi:recombination protein NinB [Avibacterium paragallinarum]|uniref:NinB protein n=2 Tax=Avibacterium paragallinarum TaxID=728 RepID=A0A0F5EVG5_AVIPA|nr:recombination protein NinB [Avibacterium paragallinarum]KKB00390.1 recombinase [Avibacterium paragallinarum]RZN68597.1 recombination protein NinB [Avibacterium paragallinarum]RZN74056.1 recombination protein NinB [Avibacterium paragallinarum]SUU97313.1 NinB protein [Avibacterium paragallinarum]
METKQRFFLRNARIQQNAIGVIHSLTLDDKNPLVVEIKPLTRTLAQNAKLHAMLGDIAKQCEFQGKKRDIETWKMIMVSAHNIAKGGQAEMAIGLEGEVLNLRESTAEMGVKRLASLIDYVDAWAAEQGVRFSDKQGFYGY